TAAKPSRDAATGVVREAQIVAYQESTHATHLRFEPRALRSAKGGHCGGAAGAPAGARAPSETDAWVALPLPICADALESRAGRCSEIGGAARADNRRISASAHGAPGDSTNGAEDTHA